MSQQRTTTPSTTTTIIDDVENLLDDFYLLNKKPRNHIGNYYDKVRHCIDMERERIILEAHQMIKRISKGVRVHGMSHATLICNFFCNMFKICLTCLDSLNMPALFSSFHL